MHNIHRLISRLASTSLNTNTTAKNRVQPHRIISSRVFSVQSDGGGGGDDEGKDEWEKAFSQPDELGWDMTSSWSTGLTKEHFDGEAVGHRTTSSTNTGGSGGGGGLDATQTALVSTMQEIDDRIRELEAENKKGKGFVDGWGERMREMSVLLKQVREPGARGSYLKDSEKAEMYRLHKENPEVYTVERLAKDYRIMRQRVHAILWLKELEEEEEKKFGRPLDDSVELLLDTFPE